MSRVIVRSLNTLGGAVTTVAPLYAPGLFFSGIDNVALTPQAVTPTGGVSPYTFVAINFPAGVTVNGTTGVISGTPISPGQTTNASVTVTDSAVVPNTLSVPIFFSIVTGTFADSFARADQPFFVGDSWACMCMDQSNAVGANIAAAINVAGNQLNLANCSPNGVQEIILFPITVDWPFFFVNHAQYAQAQMSADNSGGANFAFNGPCAMMNTNKSTGYFIQTNSPGNSLLHYVIVSMNGSGAQTTIDNNGGAGYAFALGNTLRIEAYPNTPVANQTTIKHYINGVLKNSFVDSTNHYNSGVYGIHDFFVSAGIVQSWQNFQGGILS